MKSCQEITRLLSESQERALTVKERILLKMHTIMCFGCGNFEKQMHMLRRMARAYAKGNRTNEPTRKTDQ